MRKLLAKLFPRSGFKVTRIESLFGGLLAGVEINQLSNFESYLKAGTKRIWAAWKACDLCGKAVMDTPYKVTRRNGTGEPIENSPVNALLANPNPFETFSDLVYKWVFHIKLTGNAFWLKDQTNFNGDRPRALYALNPKRIKVVVDPRRGVIGYIFMLNGVQVPFEVEDIIHFKTPHANNEYYGLGEIESGENLFNEFLRRDEWQQKFWLNGAAPSGVLICEQDMTDEEEFQKAKRQWNAEYGGTSNAGKTAWLTGKWNYTQLGLTAVEMQNLEQSQFNIENIFHQMGIPLSVAGIKEAANFATARVDEMMFRRYTIKPLVKILRDTLQIDLVVGFDPNLEISFDIAGLIDVDAVVQSYIPMFDRGVFSINEMRRAMGFAPKDDDPLFDQHFINAGLVPIDLAGIGAQQTEEASRAIIQRFIAASQNGQQNSSTRRLAPENIER